MSSRLPRHAVPAIAGICIVLAAAVEAQQPASTPGCGTGADSAVQGRAGPFARPISSKNGGPGVLHQGFQMMFAFAKLEAVRSFREAWKRDPDCAICYWGEAWAWGSYLNGPMSAEESPLAYAAAKKALVAERPARPGRNARSSTRIPCATSRTSRQEARRAGPRLRRRDAQASPEAIPTTSTSSTLYADALFLLEPRRGTRDVNAPNIQRLHGVLEKRADARCEASGRVSPLRARDRVDGAAGQGRGVRVPGKLHSRRQPHQPHAVAHVQRSRPLG